MEKGIGNLKNAAKGTKNMQKTKLRFIRKTGCIQSKVHRMSDEQDEEQRTSVYKCGR